MVRDIGYGYWSLVRVILLWLSVMVGHWLGLLVIGEGYGLGLLVMVIGLGWFRLGLNRNYSRISYYL